jgi:hypothetical protein
MKNQLRNSTRAAETRLPIASEKLCQPFKTPTHGDAQLGVGLRAPSRPLRLSRDLRDISADRYRLPSDGRKVKAIARERMGLAEWLGTFADGDGSRIWPGVKAMSDHFKWSRAKTFRLLADLKDLKLLEDEKNADGKSCLNGERGTRKRHMNLPAFLGAEVQDSRSSPGAGVSHSPGSGVSHSQAGVSRYVRHNRHLTDTNPKTPLPPAPAGEQLLIWGRETIVVEMGRRRRIPKLEPWCTGGRGSDVIGFLQRRGFRARLLEAG